MFDTEDRLWIAYYLRDPCLYTFTPIKRFSTLKAFKSLIVIEGLYTSICGIGITWGCAGDGASEF